MPDAAENQDEQAKGADALAALSRRISALEGGPAKAAAAGWGALVGIAVVATLAAHLLILGARALFRRFKGQ